MALPQNSFESGARQPSLEAKGRHREDKTTASDEALKHVWLAPEHHEYEEN